MAEREGRVIEMREHINIARHADNFPDNRGGPDKTPEELCAPLYERLLRGIEAWIARGRGMSKKFYAPPLCQDKFKEVIEAQLIAEGYSIQYLPEHIKVIVE